MTSFFMIKIFRIIILTVILSLSLGLLDNFDNQIVKKDTQISSYLTEDTQKSANIELSNKIMSYNINILKIICRMILLFMPLRLTYEVIKLYFYKLKDNIEENEAEEDEERDREELVKFEFKNPINNLK